MFKVLFLRNKLPDNYKMLFPYKKEKIIIKKAR